MNRNQKALTVGFVILFLASVCWFPWSDPNYPDMGMRYAIWKNFGGRADWPRIITEWVALSVAYTGFFFVLAGRKS